MFLKAAFFNVFKKLYFTNNEKFNQGFLCLGEGSGENPSVEKPESTAETKEDFSTKSDTKSAEDTDQTDPTESSEDPSESAKKDPEDSEPSEGSADQHTEL